MTNPPQADCLQLSLEDFSRGKIFGLAKDNLARSKENFERSGERMDLATDGRYLEKRI